MKSLVLISLLLAILGSTAYSMTITYGTYMDPKNPEMCTMDNNMVLKPKQSIKNPHGKCEILTCYGYGHATTVDCSKQGMRHGCTEGNVISPGAMYPECCKREIVCETGYYSKEGV